MGMARKFRIGSATPDRRDERGNTILARGLSPRRIPYLIEKFGGLATRLQMGMSNVFISI